MKFFITVVAAFALLTRESAAQDARVRVDMHLLSLYDTPQLICCTIPNTEDYSKPTRVHQ
jgi:hypothetical protein